VEAQAINIGEARNDAEAKSISPETRFVRDSNDDSGSTISLAKPSTDSLRKSTLDNIPMTLVVTNTMKMQSINEGLDEEDENEDGDTTVGDHY